MIPVAVGSGFIAGNARVVARYAFKCLPASDAVDSYLGQLHAGTGCNMSPWPPTPYLSVT